MSSLIVLYQFTFYRKEDIRTIILRSVRERADFGRISTLLLIEEFLGDIFKEEDLEGLQEIYFSIGKDVLPAYYWDGPSASELFKRGQGIGQIIGEKYNWKRLIKEAELFENKALNWETSIFQEMGVEQPKIEH